MGSRSPRRNHHPNLAAVYRAVVTKIFFASDLGPEDKVTMYMGPFMSKGAAKAAISREKPKFHMRKIYRVEGHVEYSPLRWTIVPDKQLMELEQAHE